MKVKIIQDAVIFISDITAEQFGKAKRFIPGCLTLTKKVNEKNVPICAMDYADEGSVNNNGIIYDSTTDSGKLCITLVGTEGFDPHLSAAEKQRVVAERHSGLIIKMNALEAQIVEALAEKESEIVAATEAITTVALEAEEDLITDDN